MEAARAGGAVLRQRWGTKRTIEFKGRIDLVTDADRASEEAVVGVLKRHFPGHRILAEEGGALDSPSGYRWIIDPLDGTTNFAHGVPHYCVSVGCEGPAGIEAGAILDPVRDELFQASRGGGSWLNGVRLSVSTTSDLGDALLGVGFPADIWTHPEEPLALFGRFSQKARGMRRPGSAALDLAYVAAGRFDGFYEQRLKAWDVAAGSLLITEAGGRITHLLGGPMDLARADVLASNGHLHAKMLEIVREVMA